jgi:hypothetical protein
MISKIKAIHKAIHIYREPAGVISGGPCWVAVDDAGYLYTGLTLLELVVDMIVNWRSDRSLVG